MRHEQQKTTGCRAWAEIDYEVQYLGVPSCAYRVGGYTINRDGTIDGDLEAINSRLFFEAFECSKGI